MELVSFLAGEGWSDHPACTHPLLAALARDINDHIGDDARRQIAPLVPDVIGLTWRDPVIDARLAREVALAALPVAAAERQRVVAVGVLRCEHVLNDLEGRPAEHLSAQAESALADVPHARDWARGFCGMGFGRLDKFSRRSAPTIVHSAVSGIALAAVSDADSRLVDLLRQSIADCRAWTRHEAGTPVATDQWREMCELTRRKGRRVSALP
jgi:hypothetical protein